MGVKKAKSKKVKKTSKASGVLKSASSIGAKLMGGASSRSSGVRRHKQTPEKLAKKLLMLKLQKKIYKVKYGGR